MQKEGGNVATEELECCEDCQIPVSYTHLAEDWEHASHNNGLIEERIEGEQGKTYMLDIEHPNNILKIESLSENSEENVIQVYYKAYHLTGYYTTYATVKYIDKDTDEMCIRDRN